MTIENKRRLNERKFSNRKELPDGSRKYWLEVKGRHGWQARYIKEVDAMEETLKFIRKFMMAMGI